MLWHSFRAVLNHTGSCSSQRLTSLLVLILIICSQLIGHFTRQKLPRCTCWTTHTGLQIMTGRPYCFPQTLVLSSTWWTTSHYSTDCTPALISLLQPFLGLAHTSVVDPNASLGHFSFLPIFLLSVQLLQISGFSRSSTQMIPSSTFLCLQKVWLVTMTLWSQVFCYCTLGSVTMGLH